MSGVKTSYPASNAVDGMADSVTRSYYTTDALAIDLGVARTPNLFGVIHHNIDYGRVCAFQASSSAGFGVLDLNRGAAARDPSFWLDLRGFPATSRYWRCGVNANSVALSLGEVVIAQAFAFSGILVDPPTEDIYAYSERATLEYGKVTISSTATVQRATTLTLNLTAADLVLFEQVCDEVGALTSECVIVVPDTRRNDIWFVEWPPQRDIEYSVSDRDQIRVSLPLVEQPGGVL